MRSKVLVLCFREDGVFVQFSMTDDALPTLNKQTNESQANIGALVLQLSDAIAPLEGKFQGDAAVKFQEFHANSVQYANDLDNAMASISEGQAGVQRSFDEIGRAHV